jgi:hypothetical protein
VGGLVTVLVGSGSLVAHGVQVGKARVHWHSLDPPFWGRLRVVRVGPPPAADHASPLPEFGPEIGRAVSLWWGAICVHTCTEPDDHILLLYHKDLGDIPVQTAVGFDAQRHGAAREK